MTMNAVFLDGFLIANPEKRRTQRGRDVTSARIVHRENSDDPGMFITVYAWDDNAENLAQFKKGDLLNVVGKLTCRSWTDKAGAKRVEFEIEANGAVASFFRAKPKPKVDGMAYAPPGFYKPDGAGHPHRDAGYDIPDDK